MYFLHAVKTQKFQNLLNTDDTDNISIITVVEPAIHPILLIFPPIWKFPAHLNKGFNS